MTRQTWQSWAPNRAIAALAAALLAAPLAASAATVIGDGTITFLGMITAPPLRIAAAPAVAAMRAGTAGEQAAREGSGVTLTFNTSPGVVSGADVALQVPGAARSRDTVAARFVDRGGRVLAAHDGHYDVGHDGGVLSLSPVRTGWKTEVVVVTSYD